MARKPRTKTIERHTDEMPTRERLERAGEGGYAIGDDRQGGRTYTILSPLDRLYSRNGLEDAAYRALAKYRIHWHYAGLQASLPSVDLNRVFAADPTNFSGMARSERQAFHRKQYREAVQVLGMRVSALVQKVVCEDMTLQRVGVELGYSSRSRAGEAAANLLNEAGKTLAKLWGT